MTRLSLTALVLTATLALSACQSAEEKAEEHYQSALALLAEGDTERAIVELRNVFQNDDQHLPARRTMADLRLAEGDLPAAYRNYATIAEQTPDDAEVRRILAEIALEVGEIDEARRHADAAIALTPEAPEVKVLATAFAYQDAVETRDLPAMAAAAEEARLLLADLPGNDIARRVVIDNLLKSDAPGDALPEIDQALELRPDSYQYNALKLQLLDNAGDMEGVGAQLKSMVTLFPEDEEIARTLIRWYLAQGDVAGAESFLRGLAGGDTDAPEGHVAVVQLLQATEGDDAARAELDRLAAANAGMPNADLYRALAALIVFDEGNPDTAIATLQEIVAAAAPAEGGQPTEQTLRIKVMLARLLAGTGDQVGARAQVEEVIAADASNVEALKMRAAWAIDDDNPADAIIDLRTALGQAPRDADILTLMAQAHERNGDKALAGERLAQAVDVSGAAAAESLRYVQFLQREGRTAAALTVLADARNANPQDIQVLGALGEALLAQQSWVQVQRVIDDLGEIGTEEAQLAARSLNAALLVGQDRLADSLAFLEAEIAAGATDNTAVLQLVQIQLRDNNPAEARRILDGALATSPDDPALRLMDANLAVVEGDTDRAETVFRAVIADYPQAENPVRLLYTLLRGLNRPADATAVLDEGIARIPEGGTLQWIKASELELAGDIDGAIAVYEGLYARDSSNVLVANNLASLIGTHKSDAESLERAATIARRLRDADVPAFQDTYGWIAYRQGDHAEARRYLEPAAEGLPQDPLVQYHLGMTYVALQETALARETLTRALEIAGDSPLPQFVQAREALAALPAE